MATFTTYDAESLEGAFELPSQVVRGLDPRWDAIVEKSLQPNPSRRYQRMAEFLQAIEVTSARQESEWENRPTTAPRAAPTVGQCPKCEAINPEGNRFCSACGASLYEVCLACKSENRIGTKHCGKCGADMVKLHVIEDYRREATEVLVRSRSAPAKDAGAILLQALDAVRKLLTESPADENAKNLKSEIERQYHSLLHADAAKLVAQAHGLAADAQVALLEQAHEILKKLLTELPGDAETEKLLAEVLSRLRGVWLDHVRSQRSGEAMGSYREMLQWFPDDIEAKESLQRLEEELVQLDSTSASLIKAGRLSEAKNLLEEAEQQFGGENQFVTVRDRSRSLLTRCVELDQSIQKDWAARNYVAVVKLLDELDSLNADLAGMPKAEVRAEAERAVAEARALTQAADRTFGERSLREALAPKSALSHKNPLNYGMGFLLRALRDVWRPFAIGRILAALSSYEKAVAVCADFRPAMVGTTNAVNAIERVKRTRCISALWVFILALLMTVIGSLVAIRRSEAKASKELLERIFSASADHKPEELYDAYKQPAGSLLQTFQKEANVVAFSPNGREVLSARYYDEPELWDIKTGRTVRRFKSDESSTMSTITSIVLTSIVFSPDARHVLAAPEIGRIRLWDVDTGRVVRTFCKNQDFDDQVLSPDGRLMLAEGPDNDVSLYDVVTGTETKRLNKWYFEAAFSPDARYVVASARHGLELWDLSTEETVRSFVCNDDAPKVAFSFDGRFVLSGSDKGTLRLWEVATGRELRTIQGHTKEVLSVAFSPV